MADEKKNRIKPKESQAPSSFGGGFAKFMSGIFTLDPKPNTDDEKSALAATRNQRLEAAENTFKNAISSKPEMLEIFSKFDLVEKEILIGLFKHGILFYGRFQFASFSVFLNQYHQFWHAKKTPLSKDSKMIENLKVMERYSVVRNQFDKHAFIFFSDLDTALGSGKRPNTFDYNYFFILFLDPIRRLRELDAESCDSMMHLLGWMLKNIDVSNAPPSYLENIKILAIKYNVKFNEIIKSFLKNPIRHKESFDSLMTIFKNLADADRLGIDLNNDHYLTGIAHDENTYTSLCGLIGEEKIPDGKRKKAIERFYALPCKNPAKAFRVLQALISNGHPFEEALKLLEQRPSLISLIYVATKTKRDIPKFLHHIKAKTNEELGFVASKMETLVRYDADDFFLDVFFLPDTFPAGVNEFVLSLASDDNMIFNAFFDIREIVFGAQKIIKLYQQQQINIHQLQILLAPRSIPNNFIDRLENLYKNADILEFTIRHGINITNFHLEKLTNEPKKTLTFIDNLRSLKIQNKREEFIQPALELFCLLDRQNKNLLGNVLCDLQKKQCGEVEDFLNLFKERPNLIQLIHIAKDIDNFNLPDFIKIISHRNNDEIHTILSCLRRLRNFHNISPDFLISLVSMDCLHLPDVQAFMNSLPDPAEEKLYTQIIDFVKLYVEITKTRENNIAGIKKFLDPIPKNCRDVSNLIGTRESIFITSYLSDSLFADLFKITAEYLSPLDRKETDRLLSYSAPEQPPQEHDLQQQSASSQILSQTPDAIAYNQAKMEQTLQTEEIKETKQRESKESLEQKNTPEVEKNNQTLDTLVKKAERELESLVHIKNNDIQINDEAFQEYFNTTHGALCKALSACQQLSNEGSQDIEVNVNLVKAHILCMRTYYLAAKVFKENSFLKLARAHVKVDSDSNKLSPMDNYIIAAIILGIMKEFSDYNPNEALPRYVHMIVFQHLASAKNPIRSPSLIQEYYRNTARAEFSKLFITLRTKKHLEQKLDNLIGKIKTAKKAIKNADVQKELQAALDMLEKIESYYDMSYLIDKSSALVLSAAKILNERVISSKDLNLKMELDEIVSEFQQLKKSKAKPQDEKRSDSPDAEVIKQSYSPPKVGVTGSLNGEQAATPFWSSKQKPGGDLAQSSSTENMTWEKEDSSKEAAL